MSMDAINDAITRLGRYGRIADRTNGVNELDVTLRLADLVTKYLDAVALFQQARHEFECISVSDPAMHERLREWQHAATLHSAARLALTHAIDYEAK